MHERWFTLRSLLSIICFFLLLSHNYAGIKGDGVTKVVIDAGHGGKDPGCVGTKTKEKDIALSIALKIGNYIEKNYSDVTVIYTRHDDKFIELFQRAEIANKNKADLFISIHCNASPSANSYGVETYVMGLHKSEANLSVAKKENSSILLEDNYKKKYAGFDPNSPESYIIFSLFQNAYLDRSLNIASKIENKFAQNGRTDRGVKQAGFLVLWKTYMPSMLVEVGFLSNREEEVFLDSEKGQNTIAFSIFKAFKEYKDELEGTTQSANNKQQTINETANNLKQPTISKLLSSDTFKKSIVDSSRITIVNKPKTVSKINVKDSIIKPAIPITLVIFKVQFYSAATEKSKKSKEFKGLEGVGSYFENGLYKYTVGNESNLDDAKKILKHAKEVGFKDAFIIAFVNEQKIGISEALKLINKNK